ncbi:MAG: hypothetical protein JNL58_13845 [Planctomyces sp.]|nr:hypothetical protein [Planctomyces sp.]
MRWLICTVLVLLTEFPSAAFGQFPPPPSPPSLNIPNCPIMQIGLVNGIYYWRTETCTSPLLVGIGQTNMLVQTGCNGTSCFNPINPLVADAELRQQVRESSPACSMTGDSETVLNAIKIEVDQNQVRLERLLRMPTEISDYRRARLNSWRHYYINLKAYLSSTGSSAHSTQQKVQNYCNVVLPAFELDRRIWSSPRVKFGRNYALVKDESMSAELASASDVSVSPSEGIIIEQKSPRPPVCVEIPIINPGDGQPEKVYFLVLTFRGIDDKDLYSQIGVQVSGPGSMEVVRGRFTDRNSFGHKIAVGDDPFLVVSKQDLSIRP